MRGHALNAQTDAAEPLRSAREAVGSAIETVRHGASDAQERIIGFMPTLGQFVGRVAYTSGYGLSYGIVFPVMLVARIVPMNNALGHGLRDGASAARERVESWGGKASDGEL